MNEHQERTAALFAAAAQQLRTAALRSELIIREIPTPEHIAPHAIAFSAGVNPGIAEAHQGEGDSPYGAGRLILLCDPDSAAEWGGPFRIVCFAQAPLEIDIGTDPFIADVAWSWLLDALDLRQAEYAYISGTATKTLSSGFGTLNTQSDAAQIEIRASWTPLGSQFTLHAEAWGELLCLLAGFPHQEGVASLGAKRTQRSHKRGVEAW